MTRWRVADVAWPMFAGLVSPRSTSAMSYTELVRCAVFTINTAGRVRLAAGAVLRRMAQRVSACSDYGGESVYSADCRGRQCGAEHLHPIAGQRVLISVCAMS